MVNITQKIWKANDTLLHGRYKYVRAIELEIGMSMFGAFCREMPGRGMR